uniref:G-protein coupled receptors family 3 profile domain-containing protein n=1 Tax=Xenopus tropicalis TaxID=8364 RepID=A0A6I8RTL9_XENTR
RYTAADIGASIWHPQEPFHACVAPQLFIHLNAEKYFQNMQALIFAVEEINSDPGLLPNITLGYQVFDTCFTLREAAKGTLLMLSGGKDMTPNYHCHKGAPLAGIVGDSWTTAIFVSASLCFQISYFATSPILSDRDTFPSFFRTIPSDEYQMRGLAQLVLYFGWTWVGLLADDDDYGQYGLQVVKQEIINGGACVAFSEYILTGQADRDAPRLVQILRESTARVVVVISSNFVIVVEELLKQNVTGNTWIASEAWATSDLLSKQQYQGILLGTIGLAIHNGPMPMFTKYLSNLHPSKLNNQFILDFWEQAFSCKWLGDKNVVGVDNDPIKACTGNESLEGQLSEDYHRVSLNVYTAVYAIVWALQNMLNCKPGTGPFLGASCANISSFQAWQLLHYIQNVSFKTKDGSRVFFDAKGNPPAIYDIVNWRLGAKGTAEQVTVGSYDLSAPDGKTLNVDRTKIIWINGNAQIPISKCNPSCYPGFRKVIIPGKPPCCYECARCPQGQISNQTDTVECHPCSWDTWPNLQQDRCLPRPTEFLSYGDPLGFSLACTAIFSSLIPLVILRVFVCYKETPIVRANNYSLSCLLLLSLFLCFLCSLGFIGYPQPEKCLLHQVAFGMVFALCISCVLAKTITVVIAFNATKPGSRLRQWTGVKVSYSVILTCVSIQLFVCAIWLVILPPFLELDVDTKPGVMIVNCNEGSPTAFWCMLGYLGLLASISFIVAFLARRLPDSFNEAKLITFSMLAFLSVWVSFIPAYLSARGMYTVAMEVFAILSSSWAVVGCIFVPKCFIILLRPNMNSREHLMGKGRGQK